MDEKPKAIEKELEPDPGSKPGDEVKKKRKSPSKPWKKPEDMPKRPLSAYNLFFRDERNRIMISAGSTEEELAQVNHPGAKRKHVKVSGLGFAPLAKQIAAKWKDLSQEEKDPYERIASENKRKYSIAVAKWRLQQKEKEGAGDTEEAPGHHAHMNIHHQGSHYPSEWFEASFNTATTTGLTTINDDSSRSGGTNPNVTDSRGFNQSMTSMGFNQSMTSMGSEYSPRPLPHAHVYHHPGGEGVSPFLFGQSPSARPGQSNRVPESFRASLPVFPFTSFNEPSHELSPRYTDSSHPNFDTHNSWSQPTRSRHLTHMGDPLPEPPSLYHRSHSLPGFTASTTSTAQTSDDLGRSLPVRPSPHHNAGNPVSLNWEYPMLSSSQSSESNMNIDSSMLSHDVYRQTLRQGGMVPPAVNEMQHEHQGAMHQFASQPYNRPQEQHQYHQQQPLDEDTIDFLTRLESSKRNQP